MEKTLKGKTILITGASFGIGRATPIAFAARGANVVVVDWKDGEETIAAIGGEGLFLKCDVSDPKQVESMMQQAVNTYGRIDFAFNNAGIEGERGESHLCTEANWDKVLGVNLKGAWLCMKEEIAHMREKGGGVIVNCSSIAGLVGFAGSPAYVASKHGLVGLTKTAALENARTGIRINAVCPGVIYTPMIERFTGGDEAVAQAFAESEPMGRMGTPEEIASVVLWLCDTGASFVTGQAIAVDGGWVEQ